MSVTRKLLAVALAALLHLPLFWLQEEGLRQGERNAASASQSGVTLKLAARPAPAPVATPAAVKPAPTPTPKPVSKPQPKPKPVLTPPSEPSPQTEQTSTRESSEQADEEEGSEQQQQAVGGQTLGLGGASASGANEDTLARYKGVIHSRIQRLYQYPPQARLRNQQGTVEITFTVDAQGNIADFRISSSSGSALLDRAAERLFSRLRLPQPEPSIVDQLNALTVPVTFELKDQ